MQYIVVHPHVSVSSLTSPSPAPTFFFDAACSKWLRSKGAKSASLTKTC